MVKIISTAWLGLMLLVALPGAAWAGLEGEFKPLGAVPAAHSQQVVLFEEYLSFACSHCNNFREVSKPLKQKYGKRLKLVNIPILPSGRNDAPLRLYFIAEKHGQGEAMKDMIFDAGFKNGVDVFDRSTANYLARSAGLGEAFTKEYNAAWVNQKVAESTSKATAISLEVTPTVVLAGTIKVQPGEGGMNHYLENLDKLVGQLLK